MDIFLVFAWGTQKLKKNTPILKLVQKIFKILDKIITRNFDISSEKQILEEIKI